MSLAPPPPVPTGVATRLLGDLRAERAAQRQIPLPPGESWPSLRRTRRFNYEPLPVLLEAYERFGPIFALRVFHAQIVFMLGPEANHFMLVSHADHFTWRDGHLGDLIPLLGDGLLTTDGPFHDSARRIMLPAFGRERVAATLDAMRPEIERALDGWHDGAALDLYAWTRRLALRIAMRALFGLDPDGPLARRADAARQFEDALGFWANDYFLQVLRGPRTPWTRMLQARRRLDAIVHDEIARRRRTGERGEDILSLLLDAADDEGHRLDDEHVRDQVMTLLFAGHDTTTSTIAFLFHELARHPAERDRLLAERDAVLGDRDPTFAELMGGGLPRLDLVLDETLRLFPAAWIGPRRSARPFEFAGHAGPRRRAGQLLLLGEPPPAGRVGRPAGVSPGPLRRPAPGADPQGRLRAVRGRVAHLPGHALRPAGDQGDRQPDPARLHARPRARVRPARPPDADDQPA